MSVCTDLDIVKVDVGSHFQSYCQKTKLAEEIVLHEMFFLFYC